MQENDKPVLIYATFPTVELAQRVGEDLVRRELCACVNVIPGMSSIYRWQGKVETAAEAVMIIKTRLALADEVYAAVKHQHPYEVPALLALPIAGGAASYLEWIYASTRAAPDVPPS